MIENTYFHFWAAGPVNNKGPVKISNLLAKWASVEKMLI